MVAAVLLASLLSVGCRNRPTEGAKQSAPLRVEVPDDDLDAEVYIDGNYVGQVRALNVAETGPILLAPGIHRVEVRKPGRFPVQRTLSVTKNNKAPIVLRAELLEDPS